jgi:para-nitrobenzyl esterase
MEFKTSLLRTVTLASLATIVPMTRAANVDQVTLDSGIVQGMPGKVPGIRTFEGIPFAAPPVGNLRWREPQPVAHWDGVRMATAFGHRSIQGSMYSDMAFRDRGLSEDCLYLNVWTPAKSASEHLPVMVWIFGGGFQAGATSEARQDGVHLAAKGVVVVSMNYRLGIFGFFSHPELTAESGRGSSGNYGIMDQTAAMRWVQRNIAAFGGDPGNVTVFGESAGSYSVSIHMASEPSRGLFQKAIGESGSLVGTRKIAASVTPLAEAEQAGVDFEQAVGAKSLADLRAMPGKALLKAVLGDKKFKAGVAIDGYVLRKSLHETYSRGEQARVPLLAGWNADESRVYAVLGSKRPTAKSFEKAVRTEYLELADEVLKYYPSGTDEEAVRSAGDLASDRFIINSAWTWIDYQRALSDPPVYRYQFDRAVPVAPWMVINGVKATAVDIGAPHAAEIPYVFGALGALKYIKWQPEDLRLSDQMATYWSNFAKTGNPNGAGLPVWPKFTEAGNYQVMHLDAVSQVLPEMNRARHAFWDQPTLKRPVVNPVGAGS